MVKGMTALQWSANVSLGEGEEELSGRQMALMFAISLGIVLIVFFASPALITGWLGAFLPSFAVHMVEGAVRAALLLGYLWLIGRTNDARRLFGYYGAEHKTIHAYEHNLPLDAAHIQPFSCAHPRCGTSFLLAVLVVSTLVFAFIGDVPLEWRVISRIALVPLVAGVSYEILRFGAVHSDQPWAVVITGPGLWLQRLTTANPTMPKWRSQSPPPKPYATLRQPARRRQTPASLPKSTHRAQGSEPVVPSYGVMPFPPAEPGA